MELFHSFNCFPVILLYVGSMYEKDGTKRAKARYNYRDGFGKKMKQYKTTVGEDVATQFYQKVSGGIKEIRYPTAPELANKPKTRSMSVQTEEFYINASIASEISINEPSQEPATSTPGTPSRKKKKIADGNNSAKCQIRYGSKMDDKYGSIWINCSAKN